MDRDAGIAAIIDLQRRVGVEETPEAAGKGWDGLTLREKEMTMAVHRAEFPDKYPQPERVPDQYPYFLYIYDSNGFHGAGEPLRNKQELDACEGRITDAIKCGLEVRITDSGDFLMFHAAAGRILFPTKQDIRRVNEQQKAGGTGGTVH